MMADFPEDFPEDSPLDSNNILPPPSSEHNIVKAAVVGVGISGMAVDAKLPSPLTGKMLKDHIDGGGDGSNDSNGGPDFGTSGDTTADAIAHVVDENEEQIETDLNSASIFNTDIDGDASFTVNKDRLQSSRDPRRLTTATTHADTSDLMSSSSSLGTNEPLAEDDDDNDEVSTSVDHRISQASRDGYGLPTIVHGRTVVNDYFSSDSTLSLREDIRSVGPSSTPGSGYALNGSLNMSLPDAPYSPPSGGGGGGGGVKDLKPATFKGPPNRARNRVSQGPDDKSPSPITSSSYPDFKGRKADPIASLSFAETLTPGSSSSRQVSEEPRPASVGELEGAASSDSRRVHIHDLSDLKPAFSIDISGSSDSALTGGGGIDAAAIRGPLSQEEIDLLVRLEQQNRELNASQQRLPVAQIPNSRTSYFNNVFASTPTSPTEYVPPGTFRNSFLAQKPSSPTGSEGDWDFWGKLLNDFDNTIRRQNKIVVRKIRSGIPVTIRGSMWHTFCRLHPQSFLKKLVHPDPDSLVSFSSQSSGSNASPTSDRFVPPDAFRNAALEDAYVELLKLTSPYEKMIIRDLARTFPKLDFFKQADGNGQESLFNVMKAYSLYDGEVGYCQGLSFICGTLLLHMPDEQAFACLVHLMHTYQLRNCFTPRMELLQLRLYQFDRLVQECLPKINAHLEAEGVRSTMYASQWFLTIFSYRFPLDLVFRIMDIIFATGNVQSVSGGDGGMMDAMMERMSESVAAVSGSNLPKGHEVGSEVAIVLFRFGLALLKKNEAMIMALEFEALLEFLKHSLFEIYVGQNEEEPADVELQSAMNPSSTVSRNREVPREAIDELVKDSMSSQWKVVTKQKLSALKRDYDEELKKSDPLYLAEKSLESQNQRLTNDLKRAEKMLAELNRDHCDLAGQLISVRIELAKEREVQDALKRQVADLKQILQFDIGKFDRKELDQVLAHEVMVNNADSPLPRAVPVAGSYEERLPSKEEQVDILQRQNSTLIEELNTWKTRFEDLQRQLGRPPQMGASPRVRQQSAAPTNDISSWTRRLWNRGPISAPTPSYDSSRGIPYSASTSSVPGSMRSRALSFEKISPPS